MICTKEKHNMRLGSVEESSVRKQIINTRTNKILVTGFRRQCVLMNYPQLY